MALAEDANTPPLAGARHGLRAVWINKSPWCKPGPMVYMGLLNAHGFAQAGVATDLFVAAGTPSDTDTDLRAFYGLAPHPLLRIHRIAARDRGGARATYQQAIATLAEHCRSGDRVLALTRELGCIPALLKLKQRHPELRVIHETHDFHIHCEHLPGRRKWSDVRRQWAERLLLARTDGLLCLTEYQRALYQQHFPHLRTLAQPLGVQRFAAGALEHRRGLRAAVYVGHLHDYKGLELLIALASRLRESGIRIRCYGGHGAQVAALRQRSVALGLAEWLTFEPFVSPRALHGVLHDQASVGLVPLQDTFYNRYLTCPVKALDFMGHGLPVVASDLPGVQALLRQGARYGAAEAVPEFATQIAALLDDPVQYRRASALSRERGAQLGWAERAGAIIGHWAMA